MMENVLYTLNTEDALSVGEFSFMISMMLRNKYPDLKMEAEVEAGYDRLKEKMDALDEEDSRGIELDFFEAAALQSSIILTAITLNGQDFTSEDENEAEFFRMFKEKAPELLWELVKRLEFNDYGLTILEKVFHYDTKMVKQLELDEREVLGTYDFSEFHRLMFNWLFGTIDAIELNHERYDFARRIHEHRFINLTDYEYYKEKMKKIEPGTEVGMTMCDIVIQYWVFSLGQRIYVSDAAEFLDEIAEAAPGDSFQNVRTAFLTFSRAVIEAIEANFSEVEELVPYFRMVDDWEFEVTL